MKHIILIAAAEWRYWLRSYLALGGALIFMLLVITASVLTGLRINAETHARVHQQTQAQEAFFAQPDRHPHRMVHYGHYIFRAPAPLAIFDPGLDSVTGQAIFLEGHRQNTVMFAQSAASADFGGLSRLTPAWLYQLFAPLVIILLGHGTIVREREAAALTPLLALGLNRRTLMAGKACALLGVILLLLIPLAVSCIIAWVKGEDPMALWLLLGLYFIYLVVWSGMTLCVSVAVHQRSAVLAILTGLWFCLTLVLPSVAVNMATHLKPLAGKIETDLAMLADLSKVGNGHNANDPAFKQLRAGLLKQYGVEDIAQLPVNFRGAIALESERKLTDVLNKYAELGMTQQMQQEELISKFAWLTPALAMAFTSRSLAGTDLAHYHRFQQEAEALRFAFVQGLNRAQAEKLSYQDDINRNKDEASWLRARVDASNWQVLDTYRFSTASASERFANTQASFWILLAWLVVVLSVLLSCTGRVKP